MLFGLGWRASKPAVRLTNSKSPRLRAAATPGRTHSLGLAMRSRWGIRSPIISTITSANSGTTFGDKSSRVRDTP